MGKIKNRKYYLSLVNKQDKILRSNKMKILIVAHSYVVYDEYLCGNIIHYFKDEDIDILYSDRLNRKIAISYAEDFSNTLYFLYSKENIGSAFYYKDVVSSKCKLVDAASSLEQGGEPHGYIQTADHEDRPGGQ